MRDTNGCVHRPGHSGTPRQPHLSPPFTSVPRPQHSAGGADSSAFVMIQPSSEFGIYFGAPFLYKLPRTHADACVVSRVHFVSIADSRALAQAVPRFRPTSLASRLVVSKVGWELRGQVPVMAIQLFQYPQPPNNNDECSQATPKP